MLTNRSMPESVIIPELAYPDVAEAVDWLCAAFGFEERLRIGNHRAQLSFHTGSIIVTRLDPGAFTTNKPLKPHTHAVMVRVDDLDRHYARAVQHGGQILQSPADYPYGERQYTAVDPAGHVWTFSQTISDVDPASWGGTLMTGRDRDRPENEFLAHLSAPARRALESEGINSLERLATYSEAEILALHGVGPSSIPKLREALREQGLNFRIRA